MKKIIELKTINKEKIFKPEQFENKLNRLRVFCFKENKIVHKGQRYYIELFPDHNSATLFLEIDKTILNKNNSITRKFKYYKHY